jgi:hypothetical protein
LAVSKRPVLERAFFFNHFPDLKVFSI